MSSIQLSMFWSQGQDDPLTYTNHTCEVWFESQKRSQTSNNSDSTHNPAKRKREQTTSDLVDMCATSNKLAKLSDAAAPKTPPAATPRINPIDHIFQFHKVDFHPEWPCSAAITLEPCHACRLPIIFADANLSSCSSAMKYRRGSSYHLDCCLQTSGSGQVLKPSLGF